MILTLARDILVAVTADQFPRRGHLERSRVCTQFGYCFADSIAAALRYAGEQRLDIVNLSLFADPYLYCCKNDAEQRAILKDIEAAARYAQQRGVLIVTSAGNGASDLQHPGVDDSSPNCPRQRRGP